MAENILITGASGLIGTRLTELLLQKGYQVSHLSRSPDLGTVKKYAWSPDEFRMDREAIADADVIVHLAGAGIADKRWTKSRKKRILESRTETTQLLQTALASNANKVKTFISASAIGYYGFGDHDQVMTEAHGPGNDFLARVTQEWEHNVEKISELKIRVVKLRLGVVLSNQGGAMVEIARPIRYGVGAAIGSGDQVMSWIHIDDVCGIFIHAIKNETMEGTYNAVSPHPVSNKEMTVQLAKVLNRPIWLPHIPGFVLRLVYGEVAELVVNGSNVSGQKIANCGYVFRYPNLNEALINLLKKIKRLA